MPTYQYVCAKCDHQFDKFQSMADPPLTVCPEDLCGQKRWGKGKVKRVIGAGAGLIFKGSGFHITDYRSESYKQAAKKETAAPPPASGDGKPAASKSEPKPATTESRISKAPKAST